MNQHILVLGDGSRIVAETFAEYDLENTGYVRDFAQNAQVDLFRSRLLHLVQGHAVALQKQQ